MLLSVAALAVAPVPFLQLQDNFLLLVIPLHLNAIYTQEVYSPGKSYLLWRQSPSVVFVAVNGNLCIEFYEAIFKFLSI